MTFSQNITLRKQENQMKWTLRKIARFRKINIVKHYVFSVSLTGIVRSPHFKRRMRVCINKVLVCFVIPNFVIWCIFLFPIFSFCIKVAGENPRPPALSDSPEVINRSKFFMLYVTHISSEHSNTKGRVEKTKLEVYGWNTVSSIWYNLLNWDKN